MYCPASVLATFSIIQPFSHDSAWIGASNGHDEHVAMPDESRILQLPEAASETMRHTSKASTIKLRIPAKFDPFISLPLHQNAGASILAEQSGRQSSAVDTCTSGPLASGSETICLDHAAPNRRAQGDCPVASFLAYLILSNVIKHDLVISCYISYIYI